VGYKGAKEEKLREERDGINTVEKERSGGEAQGGRKKMKIEEKGRSEGGEAQGGRNQIKKAEKGRTEGGRE